MKKSIKKFADCLVCYCLSGSAFNVVILFMKKYKIPVPVQLELLAQWTACVVSLLSLLEGMGVPGWALYLIKNWFYMQTVMVG